MHTRGKIHKDSCEVATVANIAMLLVPHGLYYNEGYFTREQCSKKLIFSAREVWAKLDSFNDMNLERHRS